LPEGRIAKQAGGDEHLVRRLEHSLQVGRVSLGQRKLFSKQRKRDSPGNHSFFSRDFEQSVKSARDRIGEGEIVHDRESDRMTSGDVRANQGSDRHSGVTGL
jgi:hypothetical protein